MPKKSQLKVLVVDSLDETREVLCEALEWRGYQPLAARSVDEGLKLAEEHHPECVVVDVGTRDGELMHAAQLAAVVNCGDTSVDRAVMVRKPYHYAPLVHKIESLLAAA
jgi:DNA-binding NtrC family response regulator